MRDVGMTNETNYRDPVMVIHKRATSASTDQWILWSLILAAGAIRCMLAIHSAANGLFDDAYASLRYASNLAQGLGFVFNPGERVLGTTSPLHTLMLATVIRIVGINNHLE